MTLNKVSAAGMVLRASGMLAVLSLTACASSQPVDESSTTAPVRAADVPPPDWLDRPQVSKDEICAVGLGGPSFYLEDALKSSQAQALTELARAIRVLIEGEMEVKTSSSGTDRYQSSVSERATLVIKEEITKAKVRGQWISSGRYPTRGEKGAVYTLMCTDVH